MFTSYYIKRNTLLWWPDMDIKAIGNREITGSTNAFSDTTTRPH